MTKDRVFHFLRTRQTYAVYALILLLLFVVLVPLLSPYKDQSMQMDEIYLPPNVTHWLGTDQLGRDILLLVAKGGRTSLIVATFGSLLAMVIGSLLGGLSAYLGGWFDQATSQLLSILVAIPSLLILIVFQSFMPLNLWTLTVAIGCVSWFNIARVVRDEFNRYMRMEFITMAKFLGTPWWKVFIGHLFYNSLPSLWTVFVGVFTQAIFLEVTLTYLGFGLSSTTNPSWGDLLQQAQADLVAGAWWSGILPGLCIIWTVFSIHLLGRQVIFQEGGKVRDFD